jgi:hypothetical protein
LTSRGKCGIISSDNKRRGFPLSFCESDLFTLILGLRTTTFCGGSVVLFCPHFGFYTLQCCFYTEPYSTRKDTNRKHTKIAYHNKYTSFSRLTVSKKPPPTHLGNLSAKYRGLTYRVRHVVHDKQYSTSRRACQDRDFATFRHWIIRSKGLNFLWRGGIMGGWYKKDEIENYKI